LHIEEKVVFLHMTQTTNTTPTKSTDFEILEEMFDTAQYQSFVDTFKKIGDTARSEFTNHAVMMATINGSHDSRQWVRMLTLIDKINLRSEMSEKRID
jgi:hypothetical protein